MKNFNKNFSVKALFSSMIILLAVLLVTSIALAQNGTRLYLQPVEPVATDVLTIDVMAENVTDLYGLEVHLKYDPAVLAVQDVKTDQDGVQIEAGNLLPVNQGFVVANQVNEVEGKITFAVTLLNPAPAVSGSGLVARITFKVLQNVPSTINVERATLVAVNLQTIPHETAAFAFSGETQIVATAPAAPAATAATPVVPPPSTESSFPWWIVAAAVLVGGLLAMGVLIVIVNSNKPQPKVAVEHQAGASKPGRGTGSRPSAFKEQALHEPPRPRQ